VTYAPPGHEITRQFHIETVADVANSRRQGMQIAMDMGFARADATKIAVVISELARNILIYAESGTVTVYGCADLRGTHITVIAEDSGPGIPEIERALTDGYSTSGGLGLGLPGARRLVDEFYIRSKENQGTTVTATKWLH
jgi:serine/threonine-protein kinase RsbT